MSPRQLALLASGRPSPTDYNYIVPRTPHSRSGRAEEAMTEVDLDDDDAAAFAAWRDQQSEPLLTSSASASFPTTGYRSRGDDPDNDKKFKMSLGQFASLEVASRHVPLVAGAALASVLFCFIVIGFLSPNKLDELVGYSATHSNDTQALSDIASVEVPSPAPTHNHVDSAPHPDSFISYENYTSFPLTGLQYEQECYKMMGGGKFMHHRGYWIPSDHGVMDVPHHDIAMNHDDSNGEQARVCSKTITYQLDGHVGLAADLALMAQAAALARERNRTFFVDDRYWSRGKWTDHFQDVRLHQPGPEPGCSAPPSEELVACPRLARHWVINSRTAKYHFAHEFHEQYEDPYSMQLNRQRPIFEQAVESFRETIRPNTHNAELIRAARSELASVLSLPSYPPSARNEDIHGGSLSEAEFTLPQSHADPYIAVHIRRGDRHASTFPYRGQYVPMDNFVSAIFTAWDRLYGDSSVTRRTTGEPTHFPAPPIAYVASDAHAVAEEFMSALPSSSAVFSLASSTDPALRALVPQQEYVQHEFDQMSLQDRVRLTRGMVVDFAMLSGMWAWEGDVVPGATICTFSSNICKLSALGLGWERAFGFDDEQDHSDGLINNQRKRWIDLDNKGVVNPAWAGFEVFA